MTICFDHLPLFPVFIFYLLLMAHLFRFTRSFLIELFSFISFLMIFIALSIIKYTLTWEEIELIAFFWVRYFHHLIRNRIFLLNSVFNHLSIRVSWITIASKYLLARPFFLNILFFLEYLRTNVFLSQLLALCQSWSFFKLRWIIVILF